MPVTTNERQEVLRLRGWIELDHLWIHLCHDLPMTFEQACRMEGLK